MRIEFVSWGTNMEVRLLDNDLSVRDRFYTATLRFPFCMVPNSPQCDYEQTFRDMEDVMSPPVIGGQFAQHHPYWRERQEKAEWLKRK